MTLRLALTPGEPAGVGPDLCIEAIQQGHDHELVAIADPELLYQRAALLNLPLRLRPTEKIPRPLGPGELAIDPVPLQSPAQAGQLDPGNGRYVLNCLDRAIEGCQSAHYAAMITGPVQKSTINQCGIEFSGHTEYLAEKTSTDRVVMMLASDQLRVALATTHLPLRQVADAIVPQLLHQVIDILHTDLVEKFACTNPRILVCGLNPHAGEGGYLGREEIEVISPVLERCRERGIQVVGPLSADTLFTENNLHGADAVLAMYHDQGLPVLKHQSFGRAANITLGLPIIRTSVDHGTAIELAGTGKAQRGSLDTAIDIAIQMANSRIYP